MRALGLIGCCLVAVAARLDGLDKIDDKREASSEEQTRGTIYDFDQCMASCSWSKRACQSMCYNRIRETVPGKRAAELGDGHVGRHCDAPWTKEKCTGAQYDWHKCMQRCNGLKPYCRDYCAGAGRVRRSEAVENDNKRATELEHGVKRVGAFAPRPQARSASTPYDLCRLRLRPYLVGKCRELTTYYTYNTNEGKCEEYKTCSPTANRFDTLEDCEKTCKNFMPGPRGF